MFKPGDLVFYKKAQKSSKKNSPGVQFGGMGFGMAMGEVPPFHKDPPKDQLVRIMGTCGFVSFDDVGEFLGDEKAAELIKKYEDKYYGKVVELKKREEEKQIEIPKELIPPTPKLVGMDGKPLVK